MSCYKSRALINHQAQTKHLINVIHHFKGASLETQMVKDLPAGQETQV